MAYDFSKFEVTLLDSSGETTTVRFPGIAQTAENFTAQEGFKTALLAALANITNGAVKKTQTLNVDETMVTPPTDKFVQREIKYVALYRDDFTGDPHRMEIGTADLDALKDPVTGGATPEYIDLTAGVGLAFKEAFEDFVQVDGHAVTLTDVVYSRQKA